MSTARTFLQRLADLFYARNNRPPASGGNRKVLNDLGGVWCPPWETASNFFKRLGERMSTISEDKVKAAAEEYKKLVLDTLVQQRYASRWQPLSERYLAWKKRKKRDLRILIATKEYMQSIEVRREEGTAAAGERRIFFIVGLPDKIHQDSKMPIRKLARIHEFGLPATKDHAAIPARPLWRPTQEEFKAKHAAKVVERIKIEILAEVKKLYEEFQQRQSDYQRGLNP
jgi:phage gpG-like protein